MRIVVDAPLGLGDPDQPQHLDRALAGLARATSPLVQPDRLADLVADREDRVQRGHRLLKDHRDLVAADARISRSESASRSRPWKRIAPPTIRPGGDGTSRRIDSAVTLLPQPDSPTSPSGSPRVDREADAVDGPDDSRIGRKLRLEPTHFEERRHIARSYTSRPGPTR